MTLLRIAAIPLKSRATHSTQQGCANSELNRIHSNRNLSTGCANSELNRIHSTGCTNSELNRIHSNRNHSTGCANSELNRNHSTGCTNSELNRIHSTGCANSELNRIHSTGCANSELNRTVQRAANSELNRNHSTGCAIVPIQTTRSGCFGFTPRTAGIAVTQQQVGSIRIPGPIAAGAQLISRLSRQDASCKAVTGQINIKCWQGRQLRNTCTLIICVRKS